MYIAIDFWQLLYCVFSVINIRVFALLFQPTPGSSCHSSPEVQSPWQQQNCVTTSPVGYGGNNNNLNYLPCSSQCDSSRNLNPNFTDRLSVQAYAAHHGLREDDLRGYNPELNRSENPHYYSINSVLYNAHIEKARRFDMAQKFT